MTQIRTVSHVYHSQPTIEGAGVHLKRALGFSEKPNLDPFLLLDEFHSANPRDYLAGFPWHPHRGIETITYVLEGKIEHHDSMGNRGTIGSGEVQWMTAGSGIIHEEMPQESKPELWGFQLWTNLPKSHKMMEPRYRDITQRQIPEITESNGTKIKIISGQIHTTKGPVQEIVTDPVYLDVSIPAGQDWIHDVKLGYTIMSYIIEGNAIFDRFTKSLGGENLVVFSDGDQIKISSGDQGIRFLIMEGKPIQEPIAWYGPIVMNTQEELRVAFDEYRNGTFIKHKNPIRQQ